MGQPPEAEAVSDEQLLARIKNQDEGALSLLYDRYSGLAFALAYRVLGDRGQAEDVVQEAFLSVWRRAETFNPQRGDARGWLITIARNAALDRRRGRFRHQQQELAIDDVAYRLTGAPEEVWSAVRQRIDQESVQAALHDLPPEQREALELAYFSGMTQAEIAGELDAPLGTVKSRTRLGLRRLAQVLRPAMQVDEIQDRE